ncbi:hypothetical protein [Aliikangiella coralliicola]|uniref:Alpha/beta hydrolase n=1 Tax=Aliikangiella coralliicola TaxID=2592383 RepID=A0A545UCT2_9GAMM|nr:hypothetical protein [Aliikangiella coralliicola]TQV87277.1 hypothetical protein FLL46_12560 [Aliikangiella coralliicola]
MPVNPNKKPVVLIVHGVQTGTDKDQNQDRQVKQLINNRLGGLPLTFSTDLYRYEDINDKAIAPAKQLMKLIGKTAVGKILLSTTVDLVGDVVLNLQNGSTAQLIRDGLRQRILKYYNAGNPCYLMAHSLGSIYAFDVLNELIAEEAYFDRNNRGSWPVQGFLTIGSPIGLAMFRKGRTKINNLGEGNRLFRWFNYWDRSDPVVSGDIFGKNLTGFDIAKKYQANNPNQGWFIRDVAVDTGFHWLLSHTAYWSDAKVGDGLVDLISR